MSDEKTTALVTGANKGIGYEIAAGLGALGWRVGVGARDDARRTEAVEKLQAAGVDAFGVPLDVTDDASVAAAAASLDRLDVLVNNAGVTGGAEQRPTGASIDAMRAAVEVNVFGVVRTTNAMLPLLRRSAHPRIVVVSSSVGSLTRQLAGQAGAVLMAYSPSKTYLNGVVVAYARELADTNVKINLVCPGYVATDLNGFAGHRTVAQGAAIAVEMAQVPDDGPSGAYVDDDGPIPW